MTFTPTLFVADVESSSRWYQQLFGVTSGRYALAISSPFTP
jgi:hypothetical protein